MKQGRRFGLSAEQKLDVWRRWKAGQTLHEIGRAFGKEHSSIRCLVSRHGGIAPAVRRRALLALTLREREEISRGLASGSSIREIAKCLERAVSTVSREVARHGGRPAYRASQADGEAWQSALRPKRCLLSINLKLRNIVASKLILDWSPKQISGWLKTQYPDDESMCVSHETIYRSLFIQARGALKKELLDHLRSSAVYADLGTLVSLKTGAVKSLRPSRSAKGPLKWRTVPFRVTGRAIFCAALGTVTSPPWWNASRALSC
jgi:IS30 family transposase